MNSRQRHGGDVQGRPRLLQVPLNRGVLAVAALAVLTAVLALRLRSTSPARQVGNVAHAIRCVNCNTNYTMTMSDMNEMIDRGEVMSPPEQVRRFKCRGCGKLEATLDLSTYEHLRTLPEEKP